MIAFSLPFLAGAPMMAKSGQDVVMGAKDNSEEGTVMEVIDRDALRRKYRAERDKRIRPDANDQYLEATGRFAHFLEDPYVERVDREPLFDEVTVAIIGGG